MKNIFNGFGRSFTAAAVLFCMLFSILAPTIMAAESADLSFVANVPDAKEEKDSLNYVSFGASNVNGYGLTGYLPDGVTAKDKAKENVYGYQKLPMSSYPYLVANALNNKLGGTIVGDGKTDDLRVDQPFSKVHVDQLAMSSMRAEELRFLLDTTYPGDKYTDWRFYDILGNGDSAEGNWFGKAEADIEALRKVYVDAIDKADVITYDLGINNFGVFMNRAMSGSVDIDINAIDPEIAKFYNEAKAYIFENKADLIGGLADMEKMVDALAFTLVGFCVSFDATMAKIFEINPDAKVVVVSIQNLMTDLWVKVPGSEEALPLGELFGLVINAANTYTASLSKYSDKYMYADVSEEGRVEFFVDQLLAYNGDPSTLDKDMIDCYDVYDDDLNAYAQIEGLVNNLLAGIVKNGLKDVMGYLPTIYNTSDEGQLFAAYLADGADGFKRAATVANQFAEALGAGTVAYLLNAMQTTYDSFIAQKNMYMPGALAIGYDVLTECFQEAVSEFTLDFAGMSSPYKGAIENVLLASIMGLAEQEINKFAKDPTHTFSLKELYPDGFFEAVTAQINTVYPEVTVGEVKSIACFGVRTGIGNSFYGHPNKNGCKEIADTIMAAYDKGECGSAVDSKVVALRDVFVYLYENEYLTPVQVVDTAFFALENSDDTFAVVNYVYENLLLNENLDDDDRIEIIGKVYTILKGDFLGNYSPALDTVGNIYAKLVAADLLNNTEAFNIVDFVYDRLVDDYTVDEQDIYAIATYIYKTLFFTEGEMVVSLAADFDDLKDYNTALSVAEKIEIIDIVFGELENSNFVEEAPELAPVLDLYTELKNDEKIGEEALVAIFDIAFEAVAEKTVKGEEVNTEALVAEVTTELATTDKIDLATKAAIVNKVAEVVKNSNLGETTDVPVLPEIPDLTKIVGVLDRLDDKYITMDEANELLGKVIELFMKGELNEDTAVVLVKEAYNVVLADLSDEEKIEFIPALYEAIKAEYDLTDEEVIEIVLGLVAEYYDDAYAMAYEYADKYGYVAVVADALDVAIDAVFAAMDAVDAADFDATLKADTRAILAEIIATLAEIKAAVEAGNLADVEGLVNTVLALEDNLYASLDALAALGLDVIDIVVIPAIEDAIEFIETQVIPEAIKLAGEIAELAIQYLLETLDETYKYLVEMIVDAVKEYAPVAAEALYNYLLNNPDDVIWFFQNYGHYIADFFAEYGDEALAVVAYLAYTYGEDILAFVVENHAEIIEAFVYIVREYGDEAWALIEVYAEATGLTAQINKQLGAVKDAIEEQIEALKAQLRELENLLKGLKDELATLEGKLNDLLAELEDLVNSLEGVAEDVKAEILAKIEALKALIESIQAQIEALKAQIAEVVALIEEIKAQIAELIAELQAVIAELEAIAAAVAELVDAIVALVEAIKDGAIDAILAAIEAIKAAIENLLGVIDAADLLMKHLAALADALAALAEFIAENIEAIKNALECIAGKLAELVDAIYAISDKLEAIIAALDALLGELLDDVKALVAELVASVKAQIAELLAMIDALVAEFNAAYEALMAALPGIVELVKDKLDVLAAELEAAVKEAIATVDTVKENIETFVAMAEFLYYMATNGYYEVDDEESHYVALGDGSAAEGSYADMLAELLGVEYDNLAQGGFIAKDILDTILANEDIIADADLITLGFSNATVLDFVMSGVLGYGEVDWAALFGEEVAEVAERVLAKVSAKLAEVIAAELDGELDAESLATFVDMGIAAVEAYVYAYVAHVMTLPEILATLGELAPNALIVVVGGYNDLEGATIELDGVTLNIGEYIGYVVEALNLEALLLAMTGYNVVYVDAPDVETILEAEAEGELSILAYLEAVLSGSLLPSVEGHEYILGQILAAVEVDKLAAHAHEYDAVCDDTCNICGEKRVAMPHAYYNVCDADCNVCGFIREVEGHKYTADCDTTCNNCGEVREAAAHAFGEWVVTRESTLNVMGEKTRTCSKCGAVEWELLPIIPADKTGADANDGLSTGAVVAIVAVPSALALGLGGFAAFWFGYKKRSFKDLTDVITKFFASLAK